MERTYTYDEIRKGILRELSFNWDTGVRAFAAADARTVPGVLANLAYDRKTRVRRAVAANRNTPKSSLRLLSGDPSKSVRVEVATNPSTTKRTLDALARGSTEERLAVASNPSTSVRTLRLLADDPAPEVLERVASHGASPVDLLSSIFSSSDDKAVRVRLARNPNTSVEILTRLAEDFDNIHGLVWNPNTPADALALLLTAAYDGSSFWVRNIIEHRNTSAKILEEVLAIGNPDLTETVAAHPRARDAMLFRIADDKNTKSAQIALERICSSERRTRAYALRRLGGDVSDMMPHSWLVELIRMEG